MARRHNPNLRFNESVIDDLVEKAIDKIGVPIMQNVADACNDEMTDVPSYAGREHFMVSVEGDKRLNRRDYRATVIATTAYAKRHNAIHNTLVNNLSLAGGGDGE